MLRGSHKGWLFPRGQGTQLVFSVYEDRFNEINVLSNVSFRLDFVNKNKCSDERFGHKVEDGLQRLNFV